MPPHLNIAVGKRLFIYYPLASALDAEITPDKEAQHVGLYFLVCEQGPVYYFSISCVRLHLA